MTMMTMMRGMAIAMIAISMLAGCDSGDPEARQQMIQTGLSEKAAAELSRMGVTTEEMQSIAEAKKGGLDDASIVQMVKSVHEHDLKFDLGFSLQILTQQGIGATVLTQLVDMGALPRWGDDISALKAAGVSDVTILEMAKLRFQEHRDLLSGNQYASLKRFGLSDAGLLTFARNGGTYQQIQELSRELALGRPEQEALRSVGM